MKILEMGLGVIVIAIVLFIIGGMIEVNGTEEYARTDDWEDREKELRKVTDDNMFASWLEGFSQVLVFAGIGFILYDIAHKSK